MRVLLYRFSRWLAKHLATSVKIDGLWVGSWEKDDGSISTISAALDMIRTHDPPRYRRLRKDIRGILALPLPGPLGQFVSFDRLCEVNLRFVQSAALEDLASVIVHEATHARLDRLGFAYREGRRQRIEAVCVRRQKAFARRLPDPGPMAEALDRYLELPAAHFSDREEEERHRRGTIAELRERNVPHWLIGLLLRVRRDRLRRRWRAARRRQTGAA